MDEELDIVNGQMEVYRERTATVVDDNGFRSEIGGGMSMHRKSTLNKNISQAINSN